MGTPVAPLKSDIFEEDIGYRAAISEELLRKIAASVNAINHGAIRSIGSTEMAYLPLAAFQELNDSSWALLDGSDITDTDYGQFLITQGLATAPVILPDMRGQVPIGINNGRADGKQNTVIPNLALGGQMPDGIKSHRHTVPNNTLINGGIGMSFGGGDGVLSPDTQTSIVGQTQNTVNSIGVNWFIKVWNNAQTVVA